MIKKLIFPIAALLLLAPWPIAYAYDNTTAGTQTIQVEVAEDSAAPTMNISGQTIGGVTAPGDLFYVDTTNNPTDISVTLYLTNTEELVHYYRYLTLNIGIYVQIGTNRWEKATASNGTAIPDTYLTIRNGLVDFTLPGYARYKITVDSGCFYCFKTGTDRESISPQFYLSVE